MTPVILVLAILLGIAILIGLYWAIRIAILEDFPDI